MFVYLITNAINGKQYVGQHSGDNLNAYWNHCVNHATSGSKDKPALYNAVRKYGRDNFSIRPLVVISSKEEMNLYEKALIKSLNTRRPSGYNITEGGDGVLGLRHTEEAKEKNRQAHLGRKQSEETKEKQRLKSLGFRHTEETKERMSQHVKSEEHRKKISVAKMGNTARLGIKTSEETKRRISEAHKGVPLSPEHVAALRTSSHRRYHTNKGIINPKCQLCQEAQNVLVNKPQLQTDRTTLETTPQ